MFGNFNLPIFDAYNRRDFNTSIHALVNSLKNVSSLTLQAFLALLSGKLNLSLLSNFTQLLQEWL